MDEDKKEERDVKKKKQSRGNQTMTMMQKKQDWSEPERMSPWR